MPVLLTKLSNKYKCDKSDKNHRYTIRYHNYFEKDRHRKFNILEFGYGEGASVKMWMDYFTKANLVVVDMMEKLPKDVLIEKHVKGKRFKFVSANQIDKDKVLKVLNKYKNFYIIIDDASHKAEDQQYTLSFSFPFVVSGGWYVIEDLKCKRSHNEIFGIEADKTLQVLQRYLKNKKFQSHILTPKQNSYLNKNIESVKIYDKIAFIKKR
jgi:hypothetical protein